MTANLKTQRDNSLKVTHFSSQKFIFLFFFLAPKAQMTIDASDFFLFTCFCVGYQSRRANG